MSRPVTNHRYVRIAATTLQVLAGLVFVAYAAQLWLELGSFKSREFFSIWIFDGLVGVGGLLCVARAVCVRRERMIWTLLGAGLLAWLGGELYFSFFLADKWVTPVPSLSDGLMLSFYPAAYAAVLLFMRPAFSRLEAGRWLDGIIAMLAIGAVTTAVLLDPLLAQSGGATAAVITDLAYPIGDVVLLVLLAGMFTLEGWRLDRRWALLGAGLGALAAGDILYLFLTADGAWSSLSLIEPLWPLGTLLIGSAAWAADRPPRLAATTPGRTAILLPVGFAMLALLVLAGDHFWTLNAFGYGLATAALVAAMVRLLLGYTDKQRLLSAATRQSMTDELTGLGNRRRLMLDMQQLGQPTADESAVLLLLDLDGFKNYNDTFGHPAGDALLTRLGERLRDLLPEAHTYRLGGDEFCVIATGDRDDVADLERIAGAACSTDGEGFSITASVGSVVMPAEADPGSEALKLADGRLYNDKGRRTRSLVRARAHDVLLQILEEREPTLREHVKHVRTLAVAVAQRMGVDEGQIDDIARAAELHDIGKVGIPMQTLQKTKGLDRTERELMDQHTIIGERIVNAAAELGGIGRLIRSSHERWDGRGYPDGLSGEDIPLGSRIIFACDTWDAMVSQRPYSAPMDPTEAVAELRNSAGTQLDPRVVETLCEVVAPEDLPVTEEPRHALA